MNKNRIYDCITFYDENFLTNLRFEILNHVVDFFVVCESMYDHKGHGPLIVITYWRIIVVFVLHLDISR